ncbi:hypothetical protein VB264_20745 [Arcicella aquatica]|uniref:DKNYY family protein n=1 Tax=Arcicella aquatica TaxID=217141 RepID=A0ABU5QU95_9BACT|nr:hypothetical protein [Arcicella aquatica]MEA5260239.1 hypothetical protein [Arcicella aquatica]
MKIIIMLSSILMFSCTEERFYREYISKNKVYAFTFNDDSTFRYNYYRLHEYEYSNGKWYQKNKKEIVLNSFLKGNLLKLETEKYTTTKEVINEMFFDFRFNKIKAEDCECTIYLNDKLYTTKRCDSLSVIQEKLPIQSIQLYIFKVNYTDSYRYSLKPLKSATFYPFNVQSNFIKFHIDVEDSYFSYRAFNDIIINLKRNKIYYLNDKNNKITLYKNNPALRDVTKDVSKSR